MREIIIMPNKPDGKCKARGCGKKTDRTLCNTCRSRKSRLSNPYSYALSNLRKSAKKRGIPFDLNDLEAFKDWCVSNGFELHQGLRADGLTVGRKNELPERGYHGYRIDNIEPQKLAENVKHWHEQRRERESSAETWADLSRQPVFDDLPF
jgi:hypothetical protein